MYRTTPWALPAKSFALDLDGTPDTVPSATATSTDFDRVVRHSAPLVCHLEELGSYLGVAKKEHLELQEGEVYGAKELGVGELGEGPLEVGDGSFIWVFFRVGGRMPYCLEPPYLGE